SVIHTPTTDLSPLSLHDALPISESAMIVIPQTTASPSVTSGGPPNVSPTTAAHVPEIAMATIVRVVRPQRSDATPPSQQPSAPAAITTNVAPLALSPA